MKNRSVWVLPAMALLMIFLAGCGTAAVSTAVPDPVEAVPVEVESTVDEGSVGVAIESDTAVDVVTELTYIELYEQVNPSVVNIRVVSETTLNELFPDTFPEEHPEVPENPDAPGIQPYEPLPQNGAGSGFVYDTEGHIITNNHVVADAERIVVTFANGHEEDAVVIGTDPGSDLAVIKVDVDVDLLIPVVLGDSDELRIGQIVAAIGNPFGLEGSMSTGIISGLGRLLDSTARTPGGARFSIPDIVQTDSAINPGNSGGPLLNLDGEVIAVNTAIESPIRGFAGIGYSVPSNAVSKVVPQLIANGAIQRPWVGISGTTLGADVAEAMGLDADQRGILINQIVPDSPAAKTDLQGSNTRIEIDGFNFDIGGDIIVKIDDVPVIEFDDLLGYIVADTAVGQTITLEILRDGELQTIDVTLEARPTE
ncbi:MAG: PDZ domain-containing protein [Chloroflexi bacterium]|nr:PDZ domain-containing protein [Chloroflexota bacterium]